MKRKYYMGICRLFAFVFAVCLTAMPLFPVIAAEPSETDVFITGYKYIRNGESRKFKDNTLLIPGDGFEVLITVKQNANCGSYGGSMTFSYNTDIISFDKDAYVISTPDNADYSYGVNTVSAPEGKSGWTAELEHEEDGYITVGITDEALTLMKAGESASFTLSFNVLDGVTGESAVTLKKSEFINGYANTVSAAGHDFLFKVTQDAPDEGKNTMLFIAAVAFCAVIITITVFIILKNKGKNKYKKH